MKTDKEIIKIIKDELYELHPDVFYIGSFFFLLSYEGNLSDKEIDRIYFLLNEENIRVKEISFEDFKTMLNNIKIDENISNTSH